MIITSFTRKQSLKKNRTYIRLHKNIQGRTIPQYCAAVGQPGLSVLSKCNAQLSFLRLLYDIDFTLEKKAIKHSFSVFYTHVKHGFFTNHNAHRVPGMLQK